jgi:hypothetical protein
VRNGGIEDKKEKIEERIRNIPRISVEYFIELPPIEQQKGYRQ